MHPCEVDGRTGYFHCWGQYSDAIAPGLNICSYPGCQFYRVFGIVEFDGKIERVEPTKIMFQKLSKKENIDD